MIEYGCHVDTVLKNVLNAEQITSVSSNGFQGTEELQEMEESNLGPYISTGQKHLDN